jgi:transcriptional regulator with XRE-family HTH domain
MSDIIRDLAEARRSRQLSQATVAHRMGTPQSVVSRLENSSNARLDTLESYAQALDFELMVVPRRLAPRVRALLRPDQIDDAAAPPLIRRSVPSTPATRSRA